MNHRWPRILLATLGLLALATSASAECAWVLWIAGPDPKGGLMWMTFEAYEHRSDCMKALNEKKAKGASALFSCLPDTVDPREPKGK